MFNFLLNLSSQNKKPPIILQDEIRTQLRNPIERKPNAYKSINSSQIQIFTAINPTSNAYP